MVQFIVAESPTAQNAPERPNKKRLTIPKNRIFAARLQNAKAVPWQGGDSVASYRRRRNGAATNDLTRNRVE